MRKLSWLIVLGSIILFQLHSGFAWVEITGSDIGWAWAVMFELSAIYFLATGNKTLGIVTYTVVLCMASYSISKDGRTEVMAGVNDKAIELAEQTLKSIVDAERDWPITIQKTMASIQQLKETNHSTATNATKIVFGIETLLQIIALFFIMIAQVKAVTFLREEVVTVTEPKPVTPNVTTSNPTATTPEAVFAIKVLKALTIFGNVNGLTSETSVRKRLELDAPTFTRLKKTRDTGSGMKIKTMQLILDTVNNYKEA